jgi:methyl-accepting chemotaxis protein
MLNFKWFGMKTVRAKIILLSLLGIFGTCAVAGIHKYLNASNNTNLEIGRKSQAIVGNILQVMMTEEKFINSGNKSLLSDYEGYQKQLRKTITEVKSLADEDAIKELAEKIIQLETEHAEIFQSMYKNLVFMDNDKKALRLRIERIRELIYSIVQSVDTEEAKLMTAGDTLGMSKSTLRAEVKDFKGLWNEILLNLQGLFLFSEDTNYEAMRKDIETQINIKKRNIRAFLKSINEDEFLRLWKEVEDYLPELHKLETSLVNERKKNNELMIKLEETGVEVQKAALDIAELSKENVEKSTRIGEMISLTVTLGVIAALSLLSFILSGAIIRPILKTVIMIRNIARGEGDLTARLEIGSKDELGDLANWFNLFIDKLRGIVKEIADTAEILTGSSYESLTLSDQMSSSANWMSEISNSVSTATEEMSMNINTIASSVEEMSVTIQDISNTADDMSQNMNAVASAIEQLSVAVNDIARNAREGLNVSSRATEMANTATAAINTLNDAAKEISEVTRVITRIAEQTNLLALNATIEAASAGDAGRGFTVVANEIKELAGQSAQAAKNIATRIKGVQKNTEGAVRTIDDISGIINNINKAVLVITNAVEQQTQTANDISSNARQADVRASNIASAIAQIAKGANDMSQNAGEAAKGSAEVSSSIQGITQAADEANVRARQVNSSAAELSGVAVQLREMVSRFKI